MAATLKGSHLRALIAVVLALFALAISGGQAAAQEQEDSGLNIACLASDVGTIGGGLASIIPGGQAIAPVLGAVGAMGKAASGEDCALGDGIKGVADEVKDAAKDKIYDSTLGKFIESLLVANGQVLKTIFSWWIAVPTVDIGMMGDIPGLEGISPEQAMEVADKAGQAYADATGEDNPIGGLKDVQEAAGGEELEKVGNGGDLSQLSNPVAEDGSNVLAMVEEYTGSLQVWLLALGIMLGLVRIAWAYSQAQGQESIAMLKGIVRAVLIASGFSIFVTLATRMSDSLAKWWMEEMVQPEQLSEFAERMIKLSSTPVAGALVLLVGLLALLASLVQVAVIIVRNALLVVIVAVMPLAASASLTRAGNSSVEKMMGWVIALVLFKPAAALVYSIAIGMMGSAEGPWEIITGMALLAMAVLTLPALMSMVAPATQAVGGGASGAAIGGAIAGTAATGAAMVATGGLAAGAVAGGAAAGGAGGIGTLTRSASGGMATGASRVGAGAASRQGQRGASAGGLGTGFGGGGGLGTLVGSSDSIAGETGAETNTFGSSDYASSVGASAAGAASTGGMAGGGSVGVPTSGSDVNDAASPVGASSAGAAPGAGDAGGAVGMPTPGSGSAPAPGGAGSVGAAPSVARGGAGSAPAHSVIGGGAGSAPAPGGAGSAGAAPPPPAAAPPSSVAAAPAPPATTGSARAAHYVAQGAQSTAHRVEQTVNDSSGNYPSPSGGKRP